MLGNNIFNFDPDQSDLISNVLNMIMEKIMNEVKTPLQQLVQGVMDGHWKGQGANRFIQEMTGDAVPSFDSTRDSVNELNNNIQQAVGVMNQALSAATNSVNQIQGLLSDW